MIEMSFALYATDLGMVLKLATLRCELFGLLFKRSLTSVYQNRVLSHFQFAQRFYLSTICRGQFH